MILQVLHRLFPFARGIFEVDIKLSCHPITICNSLMHCVDIGSINLTCIFIIPLQGQGGQHLVLNLCSN